MRALRLILTASNSLLWKQYKEQQKLEREQQKTMSYKDEPMTPDEKKLYALMAVAEQQQNLVNQAVKELQITEERIEKVIAKLNT